MVRSIGIERICAARTCLWLALSALAFPACSSDAARDRRIILTNVQTFANDRALTRDGRVFDFVSNRRTGAYGSGPNALAMLAMPNVREIEGDLAILSSGELWTLSNTSFQPARVDEPPPLLLIGQGYVRRANHSVFLFTYEVREQPSTGATRCASGVCIVGGQPRRLVSSLVDEGLDVGGTAVDVRDAQVSRPDGGREYGAAVLRADGVVIGVARSADTFRPVAGLPRIALLHGNGFYETSDGRIWFEGILWNEWPDALPSSATRYPCQPSGFKDPIETCVNAVEIPVLAGSVPGVLGEHLVGLFPDGTLRCWPAQGKECPPPAE